MLFLPALTLVADDVVVLLFSEAFFAEAERLPLLLTDDELFTAAFWLLNLLLVLLKAVLVPAAALVPFALTEAAVLRAVADALAEVFAADLPALALTDAPSLRAPL